MKRGQKKATSDGVEPSEMCIEGVQAVSLIMGTGILQYWQSNQILGPKVQFLPPHPFGQNTQMHVAHPAAAHP